MKPKHILLAFFLFSTIIVKSQVFWILVFGDKLSNDRIQSGINISLAYVNYIGLDESEYLATWALGGFTDIQLSEHWSLQPEFVFKSPTGANNLNSYFSFTSPPDSLIKDVNIYIENVNFSIPIYIKYETKYFGIGLGPQISLAYYNQLFLKGKTLYDDDIYLRRKIKDEIKAFDYGISASLEFYLSPKKKQTSLRLSAKYYYGLQSVMNSYDNIHNSVFMASIGIPVVSKKDVNLMKK